MSNILKEKLNKISNVFNIDDITSIEIDNEYVQKYYKINQIPYSILHTKTDMIYMGISRDGKYKADDLKSQALFVEKYIKNIRAKMILELATGRGANSFFLAQRNKSSKFYGIDISEGQLHFAYKKSAKINNYFPSKGNYHDLSSFDENYFDICFVVEALCYSTKKETVLAETHRVLKRGGYFIVFDGYKSDKTLSESEKLACILTERGMALDHFEHHSNFLAKAEKARFKIEFEEDVSQYVLPTMERFERIAKPIFKYHTIGRIISKVFPQEFVYNAMPGYLMPTLINDGVAKYFITVLRK